MIIKRSLKSAMPSLKRCRVGESAGDDDELSGKSRKKRKSNAGGHGCYPVHLLGEVAAGIISLSELGFHFAAGVIPRLCGVDGEVVVVDSKPTAPKSSPENHNNNNNVGNQNDAVWPPPRLPLVRTSQGRVQVLPSRFNDSILDNWKKEKSNNNQELFFNPQFVPNKLKSNFKTPKTKINPDKLNYKCRTSYESDGEEYRSFSIKKCSRFNNKWGEEDEDEDEDDDDDDKILTGEKRDGFSNGLIVKEPDEFAPGDIVWAKSGKHYPAWPAIVLDPVMHVPQQVLGFWVDSSFCVMFFGYSGNGTQRDYAWIKSGMIFSFLENVNRFQGQTDLNDNEPSVLRSAIEEAFLAEHGFTEMLMGEINAAAGNLDYLDSIPRAVNQEQECVSQKQEILKRRHMQSCEGCGSVISLRTLRKMSDTGPNSRLLCNTCARSTKLKHFCGICKKIWNRADTVSWVRNV